MFRKDIVRNTEISLHSNVKHMFAVAYCISSVRMFQALAVSAFAACGLLLVCRLVEMQWGWS